MLGQKFEDENNDGDCYELHKSHNFHPIVKVLIFLKFKLCGSHRSGMTFL